MPVWYAGPVCLMLSCEKILHAGSDPEDPVHNPCHHPSYKVLDTSSRRSIVSGNGETDKAMVWEFYLLLYQSLSE